MAERSLLLLCAIDLIRIDHALRRRGFAASFSRTAAPHPATRLIIGMPPQQISRIVDTATRWTIGIKGSCLRRAILLAWLLRSGGVRCSLLSGVGLADGDWRGHAWVEIDGVPVSPEEAATDSYPVFRRELARFHSGEARPSANSPTDPSSR